MRFPEFSGEWKKYSLGEVADFVKERISTDKLTLTTYVSTENMRSDFGGINPAISIPNNTNVIHYKKRDVLLSNIRPYLRKVWSANYDGGCSADVFVFRAKHITPFFLYYIIANDTFINYVMSGAKGVKMPRGDKEQMLKYTFSIPTMEEQNKISHILHLLDDRISTQNKIIEKLETLIKGISALCLKNSTLTGKWVKLGDICQITTGKLDANAMVEDGAYPFFTCAERPFRINEYAFNTEALLISGNGANLGYINYYKGKFNAYQRTYVLDKFTEDIQFVRFILKVNLPIRIAIERSTSNTPYIVLSTLAGMKLFIPPKSLQQCITNLLLSIEAKLSIHTALLVDYSNLKSYLLQQMFI